jgi:uncharacterized membrane protein
VSDRRLRYATSALALAGAGIAAYLSYIRLTDTSIICPTTGCATVQRSSYSELAGVPVAYLGVLGYGSILATTASVKRHAAAAGAVLALGASMFAIYLLAIQLFVIDALCVWCVASDVVVFMLTALTIFRVRRTPARRRACGSVEAR